jgi:hypothetical protein
MTVWIVSYVADGPSCLMSLHRTREGALKGAFALAEKWGHSSVEVEEYAGIGIAYIKVGEDTLLSVSEKSVEE